MVGLNDWAIRGYFANSHIASHPFEFNHISAGAAGILRPPLPVQLPPLLFSHHPFQVPFPEPIPSNDMLDMPAGWWRTTAREFRRWMCYEILQNHDLLAHLAEFLVDEDPEEHFLEVCREDQNTWLDHVDIVAIANLLNINIHVHSGP